MLSTPDELTGLLRSHGILPTQQRLLIARALFENPRHVSAEQIMGQVNEGQANVSKATVYNTLGLFARNGLVNEVIVDPTRVFYDPNTTHHHHFYNIDTGELTDIEADQLMLRLSHRPCRRGQRPPAWMSSSGCVTRPRPADTL